MSQSYVIRIYHDDSIDGAEPEWKGLVEDVMNGRKYAFKDKEDLWYLVTRDAIVDAVIKEELILD